MTGMDPREQMARALGLDPHATWEQIAAKQAQITASAAQANVALAQLEDSRSALAAAQDREAERVAELDAAHVTSEITRLRAKAAPCRSRAKPSSIGAVPALDRRSPQRRRSSLARSGSAPTAIFVLQNIGEIY
jgi:multidrug efflux pump subunit AcrA (membrane-fusion protein)